MMPKKLSYQVALASVLVGLLAACGSDPTTFSPNSTDKFINNSADYYQQASKILAGDYVFVVDPSYSTTNFADTIRTSLQNLTSDLQNSGISYRMAVVNGNFHGDQSISTLSTSFWGGGFLSTGDDLSQYDSLFATIGQPNQPNREAPLEALKKALTSQKSKFIRSGAQLVVVVVEETDTDSPSSVVSYVSAIQALKPSANYINARVVTSLTDFGSGGSCAAGEGSASKIRSFGTSLNAGNDTKVIRCIKTEVADTISDLATDVTHLTSRYQLQSSPIISTLKVYKDNVLATEGPLPNDYVYQSGSNEVVFNAGKEPLADKPLRIEYKIRFVLSHTPQADTITVSIGGNEVGGWTYVSGTNEIVFSDGSYPYDGAEVLVNYTVQ